MVNWHPRAEQQQLSSTARELKGEKSLPLIGARALTNNHVDTAARRGTSLRAPTFFIRGLWGTICRDSHPKIEHQSRVTPKGACIRLFCHVTAPQIELGQSRQFTALHHVGLSPMGHEG